MHRKFAVLLMVGLFGILAGCGNDGNATTLDAPKAKKAVWTASTVAQQFKSQSNDDFLADDSGYLIDSVHCLLKSGVEGKSGELTCLAEYDDGDSLSVDIVVDKTGDWVSHAS